MLDLPVGGVMAVGTDGGLLHHQLYAGGMELLGDKTNTVLQVHIALIVAVLKTVKCYSSSDCHMMLPLSQSPATLPVTTQETGRAPPI